MTNVYYKLEWMEKEPVVAYVSMWVEGLRKIAKELRKHVSEF
jgi:hypothetical protein